MYKTFMKKTKMKTKDKKPGFKQIKRYLLF